MTRESPRIKTDWARDHLTELDRKVGDFLKLHPYVAVREKQAESGRYVFRVKVLRDVPSSIALLAGDCLHNLRSALDHIAWQTAAFTEFPIFKSPSDHKSWMVRQEKRGSVISDPRLADAFDGAQPYNTHSADPEGAPLWMLRRLDIIDKHETILIVGGVGLQSLIVSQDKLDAPIRLGNQAGAFNDGDIIAEMQTIGGYTETNFEPEFPFYVAFDKRGPARGAPVLRLLAELHELIVSDILPRFTGFLKKP